MHGRATEDHMTGSRLGKVQRDRVHRRILPAPGRDHQRRLYAACALNTMGSGPDDRAGHRP
jgi:hypothetical protein